MALAASKQEIKRDPLIDWVASTIRFVQTRKRLVLGALVAIVMLALAAAGYVWHRDRREAEARKVLVQAQFALRGDTAGAPPKTEEAVKLLQRVADQYPRTAGAEEALLGLGNLEYDNGKHDAAAEAYGRYLEQYPRGRFAMMAVIGRAYALEAKGDLEGAAKTLSEGLDRQPNSLLAGEAYTALARVYEGQKKPEAATKIYNQIIEKLPQTQWAQHATSRLTLLKSK